MFNLSKLGIGEWFPYQESSVDFQTGEIVWQSPDPAADEKICIKKPDAKFMRELDQKYRAKKINTPVLNTATRHMEIVETHEPLSVDQEEARTKEFWNAIIQDWTIKDEKGAVIEPTPENKYALITGDTGFLRFCNRCLEMLSGVKIEKEKAAEKN